MISRTILLVTPYIRVLEPRGDCQSTSSHSHCSWSLLYSGTLVLPSSWDPHTCVGLLLSSLQLQKRHATVQGFLLLLQLSFFNPSWRSFIFLPEVRIFALNFPCLSVGYVFETSKARAGPLFSAFD